MGRDRRRLFAFLFGSGGVGSGVGDTHIFLYGATFENVASFPAATVIGPPINIDGGLFSNVSAFETSSIFLGVGVDAQLFTNTSTFETSVITRSALDIAVDLFTDDDAFYTADVTAGSIGVTGDLFSNVSTFESSEVLHPTANITGDLFTNSAAFDTSVVYRIAALGSFVLDVDILEGSEKLIFAQDFINAQTFYDSETIGGTGQNISGSRLANVEAFYAADLTRGFVDIAGAVFASSSTFHDSVVTRPGSDQTITGSVFVNNGSVGSGITFGSISSTTYASRTNTVVTAPTGIANGNLLLAQLIIVNNQSVPGDATPPAGWTQIGSAQTLDDSVGGFVRTEIYYKIAASEGGSYTWTHANASYGSQGVVARYANPNAASPINVSSSNSGSPANTTRTALSVTTTAANSMLCYIGWDWANVSFEETPPTGMTERLDNELSYWADVTVAATGATGDKSNTCSSFSGNPRGAWLVAVAPGDVVFHSASLSNSSVVTGSKHNNTNTFHVSVTTRSGLNIAGSKHNNTNVFRTSVITVVGGGVPSFPNASNTGVPAGTTLTNSGPVVVYQQDGAIIQNLNITGDIQIHSNNVTIRRCKIQGAGDWYSVRLFPGYDGLVMEDCEIDSGGVTVNALAGSGTFRRLNIHHCDNGINIWGTVLIEDCYIHDMDGGVEAHFDCIECNGVTASDTIVIRRCNFINQEGQTAALMFNNEFGPLNSILVENSRLVGGGYTIYVDSRKSSQSVDGNNIRFLNNRIGIGQFGYWALYTVCVRTGNVDDITEADVDNAD